ncbi:MAG: HAD hydrolase family protein [Eubacterium sp.]|nr:HAD hydrolase family protein [Eubacterium sp.]
MQDEDTAYGDSRNDLEMIQAVETGVCMANGSPALLEIADMVFPAVTENGIYTAFEKLNLL